MHEEAFDIVERALLSDGRQLQEELGDLVGADAIVREVALMRYSRTHNCGRGTYGNGGRIRLHALTTEGFLICDGKLETAALMMHEFAKQDRNLN